MKISPKEGILLIKKHEKGKLKSDIHVEYGDDDKSLISGEVIGHSGCTDKGETVTVGVDYKKGTSVIFGKYSLFELLLQGEKYYFLDKDDVLAIVDYKE